MKNLDDVLKKSLTPAETEEGPDFWLNQNILKRADRQEKGAKIMRKTHKPTKAVAALVIALSISGSAVFAAEKTNLFGNLFGETNTVPVESYVNDTGADENTKASYEYQGAEYEVQIDKVVRSAATHSGIMQFTVNRVSGKGEPWYILTGDVLPEYDYWTMETRNLQEINPTDTDVWLTMGLESSGQATPDWRVYIETDVSDDDTQVFYMVFNLMDSEQADAALSLVLKELDGTKDSKTELANITIPESESIPSLTWSNENGEQQLALTSYDMVITNQGASDVDPEYDEISVQMKDGSTYVIDSKAQQVKNEFYSEYSTNNDMWIGFDHILDLEQIESVTINDTVFAITDAK